MSKEITTHQIVAKWLEDHDYDGLVGLEGECGCGLSNLFPCGGDGLGLCSAAYKIKCEGSDFCDGKCDWHMSTEKPKTRFKQP
jgi:hypothetical protein